MFLSTRKRERDIERLATRKNAQQTTGCSSQKDPKIRTREQKMILDIGPLVKTKRVAFDYQKKYE